MERPQKLPVKLSDEFINEIDVIFKYGIETFGIRQAEIYENEIWQLIECLSHNYLLFSECRHLSTKSKIYRWIILDAHLIVYRITEHEVQVLNIINSRRSIKKIKTLRNIRF